MRAKVYFEWGYNWCCWAVGVVVEKNEVHVLLGPVLLHWDWL
mgnify:CR=1 FL=1